MAILLGSFDAQDQVPKLYLLYPRRVLPRRSPSIATFSSFPFLLSYRTVGSYVDS